MKFWPAVANCFSNYVTFKGRAPRSEFWWFALFAWLGSIAAGILEAVIIGASGGGIPIMNIIFSLAILPPYISVVVRRLHDINRSGWWYWIALFPLIGFIVLLFWFVLKGTDGRNEYGSDPLTAGPDDDDGEEFRRSGMPTVDRS